MTIQQFHVPLTIVFRGKDGKKDSFIRHEELGHGGFAYVYRVTQNNTNREYAIKVISKQFLNSKGKETFEKLKNEMKIQRALNHPNIVRSKIAFSDEFNYYIVLEYCPGKSIRDYLRKNEQGHLSESETRRILRDVISGLIYLHNKNIVHHDIKLENFIIGMNGKIKIADFGLSTILKDNDQKQYTICGTTNYFSPEMLKKEGCGFEADIWAIGVAAFIMLTGRPPFGNLKKEIIYENIKGGVYNFPSNIQLSFEAKSFIKSILRVDPIERPTAMNLLSHPFLTKFDTELIEFFKPAPTTQKVQSSDPVQSLYSNLPLNPSNPYQKAQPIIPTESYPKIDTGPPSQFYQKYISSAPSQSTQKGRSPTPSSIPTKIINPSQAPLQSSPKAPIPSQNTQKNISPTPIQSSQKVRSSTPSQSSSKVRSPTPSQSSQKVRSPTPSQSTQKVRSPTPSQSSQKVRSPTPSKTSQKVRSPTPSQSSQKVDVIRKHSNDKNVSGSPLSYNTAGSTAPRNVRSSSVSNFRVSRSGTQSDFNAGSNEKADTIRRSSSFSRKGSAVSTAKKAFTIPNYFVIKFCLHGEDVGYLLGNGTVGICFKSLSRIVMDPTETFAQYYRDHESSFEAINIASFMSKKTNRQKEKLLDKVNLVMRFARSLKKTRVSHDLPAYDADSSVPLSHVKYVVTRDDSFLFKLSDKNVQVNFNDHTKMIIFWNTRKATFVRSLTDKCCLLDLSDIANMKENSDERQKFKKAKLMIADLAKITQGLNNH